MKAKRIVANIAAESVTVAKSFYRDILGLDMLMDQGWIARYRSGGLCFRYVVKAGFRERSPGCAPWLSRLGLRETLHNSAADVLVVSEV